MRNCKLAIARSATELAVGDDLLIQLGQGGVKVKVMEINEPQRHREASAPLRFPDL
ncbi:MAG: hypothetical protein V7K57_28190 [Nostoc sp.]|uniref:hypothetical protein n=1 Tax=Nostoc sp. TaxID=1180 RepID=UPI002FF49E0E